MRHRRLTYRFLAGQALVLAAFWASGHPWLYLLLWVLPWATLYQGLNRIRAIAERGGMTRSGDRRRTTHHVHQSLAARMVMVPFSVMGCVVCMAACMAGYGLASSQWTLKCCNSKVCEVR